MGSYVISVSLGTGCYRHIQISATDSLFRLHQAILKAFEFEDDHMHAFFMDNKRWSQWDQYLSAKSEPTDRLTKRHSLQKAGLAKGMKFLYLFDFGDEWLFRCKVLRELEERTDIPCILRSVGEAPPQYSYEDDDWDEDASELVGKEIRVISNGSVQSRVFTEDDFPMPEDDGVWPDYDYEGFPKLNPSDKTWSALAKLPIPNKVQLELWDYFEAAARLYGVIPLRKLLEIYNRHNKPIPEEQFLQFAEILRHEYRLYSILNCDALKKHEPMESMLDWEIVSQYVYAGDINNYYLFTQLQGDKPYCVLPKAEFLRYAEVDYHPNTVQAKVMWTFLQRVTDSKEEAEEILFWLQEMCEADMSLEDILDELAEEGFRLETKEDCKTFLDLYLDLNDHTRKCIHRGYTPAELERMKPITGQMSIFGDA